MEPRLATTSYTHKADAKDSLLLEVALDLSAATTAADAAFNTRVQKTVRKDMAVDVGSIFACVHLQSKPIAKENLNLAECTKASGSWLDLIRAPCVLYGAKYTDPVSLRLASRQGARTSRG